MTLNDWANLSTILLALEGFVFMLIPGAIFFFLFRGSRKLEGKMREFSPKVQGAFRQVNGLTHQYSDKLAAPVIKASAMGAQVRAVARRTSSVVTGREA